jgi:hypothetical protein
MSNSETSSKPRVYVSVIFCDRIIREHATDLLTGVRITDGYVLNPVGIVPPKADGSPDEEHPLFIALPVKFTAIIRFCSEEAVTFTWTLKGTRPNGEPLSRGPAALVPVQIGAGPDGLTVSSNISISSAEPGDYWFEVYVDGVVATKAPIRIKLGTPIGPLEPLQPMEFPDPDTPLKPA